MREVGLFTALSLGLCHTIGGGINTFAIQASFLNPGGSVPLGYILGGIPVLFTAIAYTMMALSMPRTGGDYIYISRTISPLLGFITSWGFWFTEIISLGVIAWLDVQFWGTAFQIMGSAFANQGVLDMGTILVTDKVVGLAVAMGIVILSTVVTLLGTKVYSWIINIGLIIGLLGSVAMMIVMIGRMGSDPAALWNETWEPGSYEGIQMLAAQTTTPDLPGGWVEPSFSMHNTMAIMVPAAWAYIGFNSASYIGGEVKNPSKSMIYAIVIGTIFIIIYYAAITALVYGAYGDFIPQYYHVFENNPEGLAALISHPPAPILPAFALSLVPGMVILQIIICVTGAIWLLNDVPAFFVVCSRLVFSWSFDRFFPERFANVNERFHSPHWAILLTCMGGLGGAVLSFHSQWFAMVDTTMLFLFSVMFGCMAAAVMPYMRRDLYERGGRYEVFGIPVMTIAGLAGAMLNFFVFLFAAHGVVEGGLTSVWTQAIWIFFGLLIFVAFYAYNTKRGVDVKSLYAEIPPA